MQTTERSFRILHVDDDPDFTEVTVAFIEQEDERFEVDTAASADEGLARLAEESFDCVVSDYDMPGQNGLEFLERVRTTHPDLPFILFTGKGSEEVASEAISKGVTDYLQKGGPEKYTLLVNRIERAVSESRLREFRREMKQDPLALIEGLSDPLYALNDEWRFTYLNEAAEELFGESRGHLLDSNIWNLFPEATDTPFYDHYHDALAEGQPRTIEEQFEPWDEWYREYIHPSESGVTVITQEITDTKEQELELQRYRELFAHVENLTQIGGWEVRVDSGQQYWTDGTYRIHDLDPRGEFDPTVEKGIKFYHPEDQQTIREAVEQCMDDGIPYEEELRFVTAEGRDRWVRTHGEPVREDGEITAVRGAIQDITDQKQAEEQLEAYIQYASDILGIVSEEGVFLDLSPAIEHVTGYAPEELEGEYVFEYLHPEDKEQVLNDFFELVDVSESSTDQIKRVQYRFKHADGSWQWLESVASNRMNSALDGYVITTRDITDRKQYERDLQRRNEQLDEFADVIAHDLRNPLNIAQTRVELAREESESEHLEPIDRALTRMGDLIETLLKLAREGNDVTELETVDLARLSEQCWQNVETADATLRTETDQRIRADRSRLQQLLENLIHNAVQHGGDDVTVTVGTLENGFYVADDGPGIPADKRQDVFKSGYSTTESSTGLGLSIAKQIVDAHGWRIDVAAGSEGGARFEISGIKTTE